MSDINPSEMSPSSGSLETPQTGKASNEVPQIPIATNWDPSGVWAKFLGGGGSPATPEQVQMFLNGMMRSIAVELQRQEKEVIEASKKLRKTIEGDDDS